MTNHMATAYNALDTIWKSYSINRLISVAEANSIHDKKYELDGMTFEVNESCVSGGQHVLSVDFLDCGEVDNRVNFTLVQNGPEIAIDTSERSIEDYLGRVGDGFSVVHKLAGRFNSETINEVVNKLLAQVLQDNMQTLCNIHVMIMRAIELDAIRLEKEAKKKAKTTKKTEDSEDNSPYVIYGAPREKFIPKTLGDNIMNLHRFKTMKDNRDVYVYKGGVYRFEGETKIEELANEILGNEATDARVKETIMYIKRKTFVDRKDFNSDANAHILNLKNGLFNVITGELKPHTPDFLSTIRINITYYPKAQCPHITKYLNDVVSEKRKKEDITTLIEVASISMTPVIVNKAILLTGPKAQNGKSKFLELLEYMVGKENCSHVPPDELTSDKFASSDLYGKLLNIDADIPSALIQDTSKLKKLVTGSDTIRGQRKFGHAFDFTNKARLVFSTNKPPVVSTEENQRSYFRRWQLIDFPNSFDKEHGNEDRNIIEKLTKEEELSGFLNVMLPYLKNMLVTKAFTYELSADEVREAYVSISNPAQAFIENCIEFVDDACTTPHILKRDMLEAFKLFCNHHGAAVDSWDQEKLTKRLNNDKHHDFKSREFRFYVKSLEGMRAYKGIIFSDKIKEMFPDKSFVAYDEYGIEITNTSSMMDKIEALTTVPRIVHKGLVFNTKKDTPVTVVTCTIKKDDVEVDPTLDVINALSDGLSEIPKTGV